MKTIVAAAIDFAISQAMERYIEMSPEEVHYHIEIEWPPQIATLLEEVFFKSTCGLTGGMTSFRQMTRAENGSFFYAPICSCDNELPY